MSIQPLYAISHIDLNGSIGPSIKYDNGKGWFLTAKVQRETSARNHLEGTALWTKTLIPF